MTATRRCATIVQLGLDALDRNLSLLPEKMLAPTGGDPRIVLPGVEGAAGARGADRDLPFEARCASTT